MTSTRHSDDLDVLLARVEVKVEKLEKDVESIEKSLGEIKDTITGVKGSWKALLAVGSILSGILVTVGMKLWDVLAVTR